VAALILDAGVLIGLLDVADAHHDQAVDHVDSADRRETTLLTPASAYSEALVAFARAVARPKHVRRCRRWGSRWFR
jgi:predicted nucleic acid-binding protein